jgi:2-isopropylmalate synthase
VNRLRELGIDLEHIDVNEAFARFKDLADKKKDVFDDDLYAIAREEGPASAYYELIDVAVTSALNGTPHATVTVSIDGAPRTVDADGDGVVDACYRAIRDIAGVDARLQRYQVKAITGGTDALGDVSCMVRVGDVEVRGHGSHTDVLMASAYAFVDALNRYADRVGAQRREPQRVVGP